MVTIVAISVAAGVAWVAWLTIEARRGSQRDLRYLQDLSRRRGK
jgi:hypothetical protein